VASGDEGDVVDFGIGAPVGAGGDGDFVFAWEIVELGIAGELFIERQDDWRYIGEFVGMNAGEGAAGDVARDVSTGASGAKANGIETVEDFGNGLDADPVELNVLADRDVCDAVAVFGGERGDGADLCAGEEPVGNADANHEEGSGLPFSAGTADHAEAVTLGVNAPGTEIGAQPFRGNGAVALTSEGADFVEMIPGISFALEALDALGFGFGCWRHKCSLTFANAAGLEDLPAAGRLALRYRTKKKQKQDSKNKKPT